MGLLETQQQVDRLEAMWSRLEGRFEYLHDMHFPMATIMAQDDDDLATRAAAEERRRFKGKGYVGSRSIESPTARSVYGFWDES